MGTDGNCAARSFSVRVCVIRYHNSWEPELNDQVSTLLSGISPVTYKSIARGVRNDPSATLVGEPVFTEITTSHNDQRTIGIVRISGEVACVSGTEPWSVVAKIIDPTQNDNDDRGFVGLEIEQKVYEQGLFTNDGVPLRPAKCYLTQLIEDRFRILWLEDLTGAPQPPWTTEQFISAANHLGQFDGYHITHPTSMPFEIPDDWYLDRLKDRDGTAQIDRLLNERDSELTRAAYRDVPLESAAELHDLSDQILKAGQLVPHGLAFGDSHSRNMFPLGSSTIGIDWARVSNEPVGADVGVLLGSAMSFTVQEAQIVARNERDIYESYVSGLKTSGWNGSESHARIGFFCQFSGYLTIVSVVPVSLRSYQDRREWIEGRFGVPFDDVPEHLAPVIELIPGYVKESKKLLAEFGSV